MTRDGVCAAAAIALCCVAVGAHVGIHWQGSRLRLLLPGESVPLPSGMTLERKLVVPPDGGAQPCYLFQFSSASCRYSAAALPVFEGMEQALLDHGCTTVFLAPTPGLFPQPLDPRRTNLAFPDLRFAGHFPLATTPTTVVTDGYGVILWSKVGVLQSRDAESAAASVVQAGRLQGSGRKPILKTGVDP